MLIRSCLILMAISEVFLSVQAQQPTDLDAQKVIAPTEFTRILVQPTEVEQQRNLFLEWQQGEVFLANGRFASDIIFNYDIMNHMLLVLFESKEYWLDPVAVDSIFIDNKPDVLVNPIAFEGTSIKSLLLRIYNGQHLSLFRKTVAEVLEDSPQDNKVVAYGSTPKQIDQNQQYFLLHKSSNQINALQRTKKEIRQWEHGDEVLAMMKKENLGLQSEPDMIKVIQYYERLTFGVH